MHNISRTFHLEYTLINSTTLHIKHELIKKQNINTETDRSVQVHVHIYYIDITTQALSSSLNIYICPVIIYG